MTDFQAVSLPADVCVDAAGATPAAGVAFTEGPAASAEGTVYFSDIFNNRIMQFDPATGRCEVWRQPSGRANGLLFDASGRLLICEGNEFGDNDGGRRIARIDPSSGEYEVLTDRFEGARYNAPNDIAATSQGILFFTDPCYGDRATMELSHDSVYRIDTTGQVERVLSQPEIQRPNGIAISPDERTLYVVDSCPVPGGNRKIRAYDLSPDGSLSNPREVIDFAPGRGGDGMAVDQDGQLFIAAGIRFPRGEHETADVPPGVWVVTPEGEIRGRIPIAEDVITNLTFGGPDLKTLYVTAGKTLFSVRLNRPGYVVHRRGE